LEFSVLQKNNLRQQFFLTMLAKLPLEVVSSIRSSFIIQDVAQAVEEVVLNSIDAGATAIEVSIDTSMPSFTVSDNGRSFSGAVIHLPSGKGMTLTDLRAAGERYGIQQQKMRAHLICSNIQVPQFVRLREY
jgi:hypothetical protein